MKVLSHFSLAQSLFISEGKFSPDLPPVSLVDPMQAGVPPGAVHGRETARRARVRNPLHGALAPSMFGLTTGLGGDVLCSVQFNARSRARRNSKGHALKDLHEREGARCYEDSICPH